MAIEDAPSSITYASGAADGAPDLRILHYNDVYHIDQGYMIPFHPNIHPVKVADACPIQ